MTRDDLTKEQRDVVTHPFGKHARVLAVAGSGKTTTMAHRIKYLVEQQINPNRIRVLMFNRLARIQFKDKLAEVGVPEGLRPQVHTFHSFSYQLIGEMIASGLLPDTLEFWIEDREEMVRIWVHRALHNLETRRRIPPDSVDPDEVIEAIGLWKGSLIPPLSDRAGYRGNNLVPLVYEEFEKLRNQQGGITYDDFVPLAVGALESVKEIRQKWCGQADFIIVDEYQDVNYGQQRLIELLAGKRADVMVVGDDDQTIYEWRGARPNYILREFRTVFANKPHVDYTLSRSFRFGPVLAQCAQNVIAFNANRIPKPLIAHDPARPAHLDILFDSSEQPTDVNKQLAQQVVTIVRQCKDPRKVIVLARLFSQLSDLEAEFLARGIPYRVIGRSPFFERREIRVLLDYIRLAMILDQPVSGQAHDLLQMIANTPNRKLSREVLSRAMKAASPRGATTRDALESLTSAWDSPLSRRQREQVDDLLALLDRIQERVTEQAGLQADELLIWLVDRLDYHKHFDNYYGKGENSEDRKRAVGLFCEYARAKGLGVLEFVRHIEQLDPTRGKPEKEQIVMTTVFRTKGLEYDYVIIPSCIEGYMPFLSGTGNLVYDKAGIVKEPEPSEIIENERRLFYVAITRARKGVYVGTSASPTKDAQGESAPGRPSRFLLELQMKPTVAVMDSLQRLAAGDVTARNELLVQASRHGGVKALMHNLIAEYLPDLGEHALAREVESTAARLPALSFAYPQAYNSTSLKGTTQEPSGWEAPEPPWWEDEDDL